MFKSNVKFALFVWILHVLAGCSATTDSANVKEFKRAPLRIGVTPEYPPMIFINGGRIDGVEADLARLLARRLDRPVQFIPVDWTDQIPALLAGKTDIIMSSMTITQPRKVRINFTDPYFKSGLLAMMRAEDTPKYKSREDVAKSFEPLES